MNTAETLVSTNISQSVFFHMKTIVTILQMCKFCHRTSVGQTNDDLYLLPVNTTYWYFTICQSATFFTLIGCGFSSSPDRW